MKLLHIDSSILGQHSASRELSAAVSRDARLKHSKFLVFGGDESYAYMGDDFSRD